MWIDQPGGGVITVAFTSGAGEKAAALGALVPSGAQLRAVEVKYGLDVLRAVEDAIETDDRDVLAARGIEFSYVSVDVMVNRVRVGVIGLTPEARAELSARYGDAVIADQSNPRLTACVSREDCYGPPLRAGISGAPANTAYRNRCSLGFMIKFLNPTRYQWLTAGHCAQETQIGVRWYQGANAAYDMGTLKASCWPDCQNADAARFGNIHSTFTSNKVYMANGVAPRSVYGVQALNVETPGDMTCLSGRRAEGWRCGYFQFTDTVEWEDPVYGTVWFFEQRYATYDHMYGDSGGAVHSYSRPGDLAVLAMGGHSGCTNLNLTTDICEGLSVYSHIRHITAQLGYNGQSATVCTLATSCP